MPNQTFRLFSYCDELVVVEITVNAANWRVSAVRCINNSMTVANAQIYRGGELVFTVVAPAGETTSWNVTGVQLGWDSVDGGIMMGDYVMQTRWSG